MNLSPTTRELELEAQVLFLAAQIRAADSMLTDGDRDAALTQVRRMAGLASKPYLDYIARQVRRAAPPPFDVDAACAAALARVTEFIEIKTADAKDAFKLRCDAYGVEAGRDDHVDMLPYVERIQRLLRPKAEAMYGVPPYMYGGAYAGAGGGGGGAVIGGTSNRSVLW